MSSIDARSRSTGVALAGALFLSLLGVPGCGARDGLDTSNAPSPVPPVTPVTHGRITVGCGPTDAPVFLLDLVPGATSVTCSDSPISSPYVELSIVMNGEGSVTLDTPITVGTDLSGTMATSVNGPSGQSNPGTGTITFTSFDPSITTGGATGSVALTFADGTTEDASFSAVQCSSAPCGG